MKKITGFVTLLLLAIATGTHAQTIDEVINKHIEARGGLEKLHALKTVVMEGTLSQMGNEIAMKFYQAHNKAMKVEFSLMDQTGYNIITTTNGWVFNPFAGNTAPEAMPENQVKDAQASLDLQGPLVDYKEKGNKVELQGKEKVNNADCYKIQITRSNGKTMVYFLDSNYMLVKAITTALVNGEEQEVTTEYSDYRKTPEGYTMAFKRTSNVGDIAFSKITMNAPIDDAVFKAQ